MPPQGGIPGTVPSRPSAPPPTSTRTGNNPRGVSILPPPRPAAPPARSISSIPKGTSLGSSKGFGLSAHVPTSHTGGGFSAPSLASILNPAAASVAHMVPGAEQIIGNLGKDVLNLGPSTISSVEHLGPAILHDLLGGKLGQGAWDVNPIGQGSQTSALLKQGLQADPFYHAATTGDVSGALKMAEAHPLSPILDVAGGYGALGRSLGAVARSGALGDRVAQAASMARDPLQLAPGIPGTNMEQNWSRNLLSQGAQKLYQGSAAQSKLRDATMQAQQATMGEHGWLQLPLNRQLQHLRQQAASFAGTHRSLMTRDLQAGQKALADVKPAGTLERQVAPYIAAFGGDIRTLTGLRDQLQASKDAGYANVKNVDKHIGALDNAIAAHSAGTLKWDQIQKAAAGYAAQQKGIEIGKDMYGLNTNAEMQRALAIRSMHQTVPGTEILPKPIPHPADVAELKGAKAAVKEAQGKVQQLKQVDRHGVGAHLGAQRALTDVVNKTPVDPVTNNLLTHLTDVRGAIQDSLAQHKIDSGQAITEAKLAAADAKAHYNELLRQPRQKLQSLVVRDPNAPMITGGRWKGERFRQVTNDEMAQHLAKNPDVAYVRMTNPDRTRAQDFQSLMAGEKARGTGNSSKQYRGIAPATGDTRPGWSQLAKSQTTDIMNVGRARMAKEFVDRFGLKTTDPSTGAQRFFHDGEIDQAKTRYEQQHGLKMEPVSLGKNENTLVPSAVMREIEQQFKLDHPTLAGRGLMKYRRGFRDTVLAMSTKLPIMHTVEGVTRAALAGATPMSTRLAYNTVHQLRDEAPTAAHQLEWGATPGGLSGHMLNLGSEDLGHLPTDRGATAAKLAEVAGKPVRAWQYAAHKIIAGQRWITHSSEMAVLGVHMRRQLQEMGHSWLDANTKLNDLSGKLAQAYKDPAMAEDAAKAVHETMGQYNNFTARQRYIVSRIMPFAPWYGNAARLLYQVLPRDHPLLSAISQDINNATQNQWNQIHTGLPAGTLHSDLPLGPGHWMDIAKFSPIGLTNSPGATGTSLFMPDFQGPAAGLTGNDPFWKPLYGPGVKQGSVTPGSLTAFEHMLEQGLENVAGPSASIARALQDKGGTMFNNSLPLFGQVDVKKGTEHNPSLFGLFPNTPLGRGLNKTFNPFFGTYLKSKGGSSGGGYGGRGGAGSSRGSGGSSSSSGYGGRG